MTKITNHISKRLKELKEQGLYQPIPNTEYREYIRKLKTQGGQKWFAK